MTNNLQQMHQRIAELDPLSGPNVMRYSQAIFRDNGDGTMTLMRAWTPYEAARPALEESEKSNDSPPL